MLGAGGGGYNALHPISKSFYSPLQYSLPFAILHIQYAVQYVHEHWKTAWNYETGCTKLFCPTLRLPINNLRPYPQVRLWLYISIMYIYVFVFVIPIRIKYCAKCACQREYFFIFERILCALFLINVLAWVKTLYLLLKP